MTKAIDSAAPIGERYSLSGMRFAMQRINRRPSVSCLASSRQPMADRQGALADGLHGLNPRNTTGARITLRDRGSVSESDCRKLGPSGESNAQPIESLPPGALGGVLMVFRVSTKSCARSRAGLHSKSVRRDTFKASPGEA